MSTPNTNIPSKQGLYDPAFEHDACGVGFVVNIDGDKNHSIVENGLKVLENMSHRGAEGADSKSGDGAGILTQIPHEFILLNGIPVPERGKYGTGLVFLPKDEQLREECIEIIRKQVEAEGLFLMPIREVPVDRSVVGEMALSNEPFIAQIFITGDSGDSLEHKLYTVRKCIEHEALEKYNSPRTLYIVSLSSKRIIYKGMLTSQQLSGYFSDLRSPYYTSAIALVHSRFSTNTFPTWDLAQPFRMLGHNGEINTVVGNRLWSKASNPLIGKKIFPRYDEMAPIVQPEVSDSASMDNILEFFVMTGVSLPRALAMMLPESFNSKNPIPPELKSFYDYHSIFMNPWDGPAALLFSDGRYVGGMLDRNGLRPGRYLITTDGMMVVASETGVLEVPPHMVKEKGRLRSGKIIMIDTQEGTLKYDNEIKDELSSKYTYTEWLHKHRVHLNKVRSGRKVSHKVDNYEKMLKTFGYSTEDIERIIIPMVEGSNEPVGSMGDDTPLAFLSERPQHLFYYFRQRFAQVTNPPIDPLREDLMMSLSCHIGSARNDLVRPQAEHCKVVRLPNAIISNRDLDILDHLEYRGFKTTRLSILFDAKGGRKELEDRLDELCAEAEQAIDNGCNYIIISDRGVDSKHAPIPSLLALSKIHHHLLARNKRTLTALIVESAEPRDVMQIALLMGFGASAVCPYMVYAIIDELVAEKRLQFDFETAQERFENAVSKGLKKIISKLGISTIRSYRGAQLFDCIGLAEEFTQKYFPGCSSAVGGITIDKLIDDIRRNYNSGFGVEQAAALENEGIYAYRKDGVEHAWSPSMVRLLRESVREGNFLKFKEFSALSDHKSAPIFLRDLLELKITNPIDIDQVESEESITKRFVAGAMSFGALSRQAHELLARAMNNIGATSNTGEGGEDPARYVDCTENGSSRSAIKQIASGRFGVNTTYLVNADEIQIKAAQGAKPGEGGQLPGYKVNELVAKTRHSIPGITLISPPPHHDIYSIEDLSQLIFDIRNVNPKAIISVKLVSGCGVGTVAAGVVKAKANKIIISGADGGTGASPLSSIRSTGMPIEIGLAEVQQTLRLNQLRPKVSLQADGQLKTGRDIIAMALLGAEEYAFGTAALIAMGCIMDRKCHTNKCPVGIATQDNALVCKFTAKQEHVENYFKFLAREVREYLAQLGYRSIDEIVGRTDLIEMGEQWHERYPAVNFEKLLYQPKIDTALHIDTEQAAQQNEFHSKDIEFIEQVRPAIESQTVVNIESSIRSTDRSVTAMISGIVANKYGEAGLPDNTINFAFKGSAGQSLGAFLTKGSTIKLEGDANDYVGKGLSGGRIALFPPKESIFNPDENTIAGNTLLYGATSGEIYINGRVGERFCVRNSGALAVVEGVGDHACEYMTGGRVVVLGPTGRNFAAGMSGGFAYVWNCRGNFDFFCNMEMVEISLLNDEDNLELHGYVSTHYQETGSPLARRMLSDWALYSKEFLKVVPIEYKKILDNETSIIR